MLAIIDHFLSENRINSEAKMKFMILNLQTKPKNTMPFPITRDLS